MSTHRSNTRKRQVSLAAGVAGGMLALLGFAGPAQASVNSAFDAGSGTLTVSRTARTGSPAPTAPTIWSAVRVGT